VDRARTGTKHHVLVDGGGIPLAVSLTGGNRNDCTHLLPLLDKIGQVKAHPPRRGRPQRRIGRLYAGRAYDHDCAAAGKSATTSTTASSPTPPASSAGDVSGLFQDRCVWPDTPG
jgi:hypothetical protein